MTSNVCLTQSVGPDAARTLSRQLRAEQDGPQAILKLDVYGTVILPWQTAHDPLEGCVEGALGFVVERE